MPFSAIGTYACQRLQAKLTEFYGQNVPEFRTLGSIGLLKFLLSPQNTRGFRQIDVESIPGKMRGVAFMVDNPFCFDLCALDADCNTTRVESTNPMQEMVFDLTGPPYRVCDAPGSGAAPVTLNFSEEELMKYCNDTDQSIITRQIARYNKRFIESLDQRVFELLASKVGANALGNSLTELCFFNTNADTQQSNLNETAIFYLSQYWNDASYDGQYAIIGGQVVNMISKFKGWQGLNAMGIDLGSLNEDFPFLYYDRNSDTILGQNDFLQIAPGSVQLVTWNKYKGEKRRSVTDLYTNGTFIDPATGLEVDFRWRYDYECEKWLYEPFIYLELAVTPPGGCPGQLDGVNGIIQIHNCCAQDAPQCQS